MGNRLNDAISSDREKDGGVARKRRKVVATIAGIGVSSAALFGVSGCAGGAEKDAPAPTTPGSSETTKETWLTQDEVVWSGAPTELKALHEAEPSEMLSATDEAKVDYLSYVLDKDTGSWRQRTLPEDATPGQSEEDMKSKYLPDTEYTEKPSEGVVPLLSHNEMRKAEEEGIDKVSNEKLLQYIYSVDRMPLQAGIPKRPYDQGGLIVVDRKEAARRVVSLDVFRGKVNKSDNQNSSPILSGWAATVLNDTPITLPNDAPIDKYTNARSIMIKNDRIETTDWVNPLTNTKVTARILRSEMPGGSSDNPMVIAQIPSQVNDRQPYFVVDSVAYLDNTVYDTPTAESLLNVSNHN